MNSWAQFYSLNTDKIQQHLEENKQTQKTLVATFLS